MINTHFATLYEDSDDVIHASLKSVKPFYQTNSNNQKRRLENDSLMDIPDLVPDLGSDTSDSSDGLLGRNRKRTKRQREHKVPECVAKQSLSAKGDFADAARVMRSLTCITGRSSSESVLDLSVGSPVLIFFFTPTQIGSLRFFDQLNELTNVRIVGVTPDFPYRNECSFPILLDRRGELTKVLRVRDPLGGGVYPIPTVMLFDRQGNEVMKIQLGYDYNVYYDSSVENNLQTVLVDCIKYTNTL